MPRVWFELQFDDILSYCTHTMYVRNDEDTSEFSIGFIIDSGWNEYEYYTDREGIKFLEGCEKEDCAEPWQPIHPEYIQEYEGICSVCSECDFCDACRQFKPDEIGFRGMEANEFNIYCNDCESKLSHDSLYYDDINSVAPGYSRRWELCWGFRFRLPVGHEFGPLTGNLSKDVLISSLENIQEVPCEPLEGDPVIIFNPQAAYIIRAMGDIADDIFVEPLISFLNIDSYDPLAHQKFPENHGREVVHSLAKIGGKKAINYLEQLIHQGDVGRRSGGTFHWKHTVIAALQKNQVPLH